jgi:hypothetical protein
LDSWANRKSSLLNRLATSLPPEWTTFVTVFSPRCLEESCSAFYRDWFKKDMPTVGMRTAHLLGVEDCGKGGLWLSSDGCSSRRSPSDTSPDWLLGHPITGGGRSTGESGLLRCSCAGGVHPPPAETHERWKDGQAVQERRNLAGDRWADHHIRCHGEVTRSSTPIGNR